MKFKRKTIHTMHVSSKIKTWNHISMRRHRCCCSCWCCRCRCRHHHRRRRRCCHCCCCRCRRRHCHRKSKYFPFVYSGLYFDFRSPEKITGIKRIEKFNERKMYGGDFVLLLHLLIRLHSKMIVDAACEWASVCVYSICGAHFRWLFKNAIQFVRICTLNSKRISCQTLCTAPSPHTHTQALHHFDWK